MASALVPEGKGGVEWLARYDLWAPARQYMVYHGQPRILTEIASVEPRRSARQPGRQGRAARAAGAALELPAAVPQRATGGCATSSTTATPPRSPAWRTSRSTATTWLENFYKVHADWVNRNAAPYAFVVPAAQRDPFETFELLDILRTGEVEIHQAKAPFKAGGKEYAAGSWVIKLAQPYGAFAKTMLERQKYPDLRLFPGGPPKPPYDVTGHTLGMLMGVDGRSDRRSRSRRRWSW